MKLGVIDLGTNTFHLLIVEMNPDRTFRELFRKRMFIQLAEHGIGRIGDTAYARAMEAMNYFDQVLQQYQVSKVKALGTAALRTASNGNSFIKQVLEETNIKVELISGDEEARLICEGVRHAVPISEEPVLIMDIGGGSVEFIIANKDEQFWAHSFPIGVAILYNQFHKSDPIAKEEVQYIRSFLEATVTPLQEQLRKYKITNLVGASGTFDVLETILVDAKTDPHFTSINAKDFAPVYKQFLYTSLVARYEHNDIPNQRAELIIVALILIDFILELAEIESIWVSAYAMKEGVLYSW